MPYITVPKCSRSASGHGIPALLRNGDPDVRAGNSGASPRIGPQSQISRAYRVELCAIPSPGTSMFDGAVAALVVVAAAACVVHAAGPSPIVTVQGGSGGRTSTPLLRRLQESRLKKAVLAKHADEIVPLQDALLKCANTLRRVREERDTLWLSMVLVDKAINTTYCLEGCLSGSPSQRRTANDHIRTLLELIRETPRKNIARGAAPCLNRMRWTQMLGAQPDDLPVLLHIRDAGKQFKALAGFRKRVLTEAIEREMHNLGELIATIPHDVPSSFVYGRSLQYI